MKTAAVIAEYNPFHLGHAWQLQEIKRTYGADACVVIMSGNYVQRGAPAIVDKFTRTKWALMHGADIVFELPSVFATAGAEQFAYGACTLLDKLGFIDMLCFGSEIETIDIIRKISDILISPPPSYEDTLKRCLRQGKSYATAREEALSPFLGQDPETCHAILSAPNTILGIEYCKALKKRNSPILPVSLLRKGNYHAASLPEPSEHERAACSASAIRTHLFHQPVSFHKLFPFVPEDVYSELQLLPLMQEDDFSSCLYYTLLGKNAEELMEYYEVSSDLAQRILRYFPQFQDFSDFAGLLKAKHYAHARIRRALLHILLSIQKEDPFCECGFLRLLGLKKESSCLLQNRKVQTGLTIITKPADAPRLLCQSHHDIELFQKETDRSQLYGFLFHKKGSIEPPYRELAAVPVIL